MSRRSKAPQGPLIVTILLIVAVWLFWQGGAESSLRSPAGMLLMLSILLVLNVFLRHRRGPKAKEKPPLEHNPYGHMPIPRRRGQQRYQRITFSRTSRAADPETWPNDSSYCVHCGLKRRGEETVCLRCRQPMQYIS